MRTFIRILLLAGMLSLSLLLSGCGAPEDTPTAEVPSSVETQAPIYSSNVPLDYLLLANQSSSLAINHDRIFLQVDHLLYGKSETWVSADTYYHKDESRRVLTRSGDPHFSAVLAVRGEVPVLRYQTEPAEDVFFLGDDFQLLAPSEGEAIVEEAEYNGAFHVITERPIGTDAEFYSMLHASAEDRIREEYTLDSATLALLEDRTTLLRADGTEEAIGTMTVSYTGEMPETASRLKDYYTDALDSSRSVTVTLHEKGQEDRSFPIRKDTLLEVDAGSGRSVTMNEKAVHGSTAVTQDTDYTFS